MGNNSVPKFIFRLSRFPVYRGSVLGRFYCTMFMLAYSPRHVASWHIWTVNLSLALNPVNSHMSQMYISSPGTVTIILSNSNRARIPSTDFREKSLNINFHEIGPVVT